MNLNEENITTVQESLQSDLTCLEDHFEKTQVLTFSDENRALDSLRNTIEYLIKGGKLTDNAEKILANLDW